MVSMGSFRVVKLLLEIFKGRNETFWVGVGECVVGVGVEQLSNSEIEKVCRE